MLEITRETQRMRSHIYRLSPGALQALRTAVECQRTPTRHVEEKVIAHVREYGRITNRTIRDLLDLDTYTAGRTLQNLRKEGLLARTSKQRRGPSVEYGPGPNFPDGK